MPSRRPALAWVAVGQGDVSAVADRASGLTPKLGCQLRAQSVAAAGDAAYVVDRGLEDDTLPSV